MSFTYDPATAIGQVRLLINDKRPEDAFFTDEELAVLLSLEDSEVLLAAADALDTMASDEAYVQKQMTLLDLTTNGPAVARSLRDHAVILRERANAAGEAFIDFAELNVNDSSALWIWARKELNG